MDRRQALHYTAALIGGSLIGSQAFLSGCRPSSPSTMPFNVSYIALLDEIAETILPETEDSPGAKAAKVGQFIQMIVTDCYDQKETNTVVEGIKRLQKESQSKFDDDFNNITADQKLQLLAIYDAEAQNRKDEEEVHFFSMIKELTLWGYFSSEPGVTKALRYNPVPGKFIGCVPYTQGEKAWY
jgi:hypothetical protein